MKEINWEKDWDFYENDNIDIVVYISRTSRYFTFGKKYEITDRYIMGGTVTIKDNRGNTDMLESTMDKQFKIYK